MIKHAPKKHTVQQVNDYAYNRLKNTAGREHYLFWLNIHYCMGLSVKERQEIGKYGSLA